MWYCYKLCFDTIGRRRVEIEKIKTWKIKNVINKASGKGIELATKISNKISTKNHRRKEFDEILKQKTVGNFKFGINKAMSFAKFKQDKSKKTISETGNLINDLENICNLLKSSSLTNKNIETITTAVKNLKNGKMINGKRPSLTATVTSKDRKLLGKKFGEFANQKYQELVRNKKK